MKSHNAKEIKEQSMLKKLPNEVTQRHPVYNAIYIGKPVPIES